MIKLILTITSFLFLFFALPSVATAQTQTVNYLYDHTGQRLARLEAGGDHTYYLAPNLEITLHADGTKTWRKHYSLPGNATAIREGSSTDSTGTVYYAHADHLGSTALVTNASGTLVAKQRYLPYGRTRSTQGNLPTDHEYTGQISDVNQTGLYYYNARYYDPLTAKFTQADTVNDDSNRYAYVSGNPINYSDQSGHMKTYSDDGGGGSVNLNSPFKVFASNMAKAMSNTSRVMNPQVEDDNPYYSENSRNAIFGTYGITITVGSMILGAPAVVTEIIDTTACAIMGGGPECVNPLPATSVMEGLDSVNPNVTLITKSLDSEYQKMLIRIEDYINSGLSKEDAVGRVMREFFPHQKKANYGYISPFIGPRASNYCTGHTNCLQAAMLSKELLEEVGSSGKIIFGFTPEFPFIHAATQSNGKYFGFNTKALTKSEFLELSEKYGWGFNP